MYKNLLMRATPRKISLSVLAYTNKNDDIVFSVSFIRPSFSKNAAGEVYKHKRAMIRFWKSYLEFTFTYKNNFEDL